MTTEAGPALIAYLIAATIVAGGMLVGAWVLRVKAKKSSPIKGETYECGEAPSGMAWVRFHARYYVVALFFVLFDIEAAFLYPWGLVVKQLGMQGLVAVFSFVGILMLGWVWAARKGALEWQ
jgi:NADH:ubiquinone oxidoreductase subunit 3 (subunit A)